MRLPGAAAIAAVAFIAAGSPVSAQGFLHNLAGKAKAAVAAQRDSLRAYGNSMKGQAKATLAAERDTAQAYMNGLASDAERKVDSLTGGVASSVAGPAADSGAAGRGNGNTEELRGGGSARTAAAHAGQGAHGARGANGTSAGAAKTAGGAASTPAAAAQPAATRNTAPSATSAAGASAGRRPAQAGRRR